MMDWANSMEGRNYKIGQQLDWMYLKDLLKLTLSAALVAGVFGFHAWIRCRTVEMGYEEQELIKQESSKVMQQSYLILEEESLKNPSRIDSLAQNDLGMSKVRANQLITPVQPTIEQVRSETMALLAGNFPGSDERKHSATN
jgi:cell division protein FtsL